MKYQMVFDSKTVMSDQDFEEAMRVALGVRRGRTVITKKAEFVLMYAQSLDGIKPEIYAPKQKKDILDD